MPLCGCVSAKLEHERGMGLHVCSLSRAFVSGDALAVAAADCGHENGAWGLSGSCAAWRDARGSSGDP
jgi:hypothetical protein